MGSIYHCHTVYIDVFRRAVRFYLFPILVDMKKFLIRTAVFGVCIFFICVGIELLLLIIPNEYSYKWQYVETKGDEIKVLILGSSHNRNGIIPSLLGDSTFNMAIDGRYPYYDAVLAERYVPTMKNLKYVIWNLGYNWQYDNYKYSIIKHWKESSFRCMYEKYFDIPYPGFHNWSELINSNLDYGMRIMNYFIRNEAALQICDSLGEFLEQRSGKSSAWKNSKKVSKIDYDNPEAKKCFEETLGYMCRIAAVCERCHVRLIVITTPHYKGFLQNVSSRGLAEMQMCVAAMKEVCPTMQYYNYMLDSRFTDDDFFDVAHLSDIGAKKFTPILKEDCFPDF